MTTPTTDLDAAVDELLEFLQTAGYTLTSGYGLIIVQPKDGRVAEMLVSLAQDYDLDVIALLKAAQDRI